MTKINQIYKCEICGNITEILHEGVGELVCCGQEMDLIKSKKGGEGEEKHVPVVEHLPEDVCRGGDGVSVEIGKFLHPMDKNHYIEWAEVKTSSGKVGKKFFKLGDAPKVEFQTREKIIEVSIYCNVHGLWRVDV